MMLLGIKKGVQRKRNENEGSQKALHVCEVVKELRMLKQQQQRMMKMEESKWTVDPELELSVNE